MTEEQLRPVIPRTESHQSLANNPATSRPPPPRNRHKASQHRTASARSASRLSIGSKADSDAQSPPPAGSLEKGVQDPSANGYCNGGDDDESSSIRSANGARYGGFGIDDSLGATPPSFRASSSGSARSYHARFDHNYVAEEIPKEEIELALQGLSRDDLVVALGRAKMQMDEIDAKLDAQILATEELQASSNTLLSQLNLAEAENESLQAVIRQREERIDEMMADQDRVESQVYSKMQVIESLRKQLNDSEKRRNDAERRYADQTTTMDKERQYYADTEAMLKSQKATQAASYEKLQSQHHELYKEHERLSNKLNQLRAQGAFGTPTNDSDGSDAEDGAASAKQDASAEGDGANGDDGGDAAATNAQSRRSRNPGRRVSGSKKNITRSLADEKEYETLREELVTIQRSYTSLTDAMATLQTELKDVKAENVMLRDQNETFIDILQEKTFSGALLSESAMLSAGLSRQRLRGAPGLMGPYESQEDDDDDDDGDDDDDDEEREADTTGNTSVFNGDNDEDEDDVDDVPDTPKAPIAEPIAKSSSRNVRRRKQSTSILAPPPTNLASELELSGSPQARSEPETSPTDKKRRQERRNERHGAVSDNVEVLQKEVRELREANQALTLYIAKIIDRIIAREGYENILAIDGKGSIRGGPRRKLSQSGLRPTTFDSPDPTQRSVSNTSSTASGVTASSSSSSSSSVASGLFRFGSGGSASASATSKHTASSAAKPLPPKPKRGNSIDWRSLPFFGSAGSGSSGGVEPNPNLKPLTLASTSPLVGCDQANGAARKVRTSEEVEDEIDVAERERIRQELLKRGIQPPSNQLVQSPHSPSKRSIRARTTSASAGNGGGFAAFISRVVTGGVNSSSRGNASARAADANGIDTPDRSEMLSDTSTTPGSRFNSLDSTGTRARSGTIMASDENFPRTSTPILLDPEKRREERSRAIQLSGSGLTEFGGAGEGEGIGAGARARVRARRERMALNLSTSSSAIGDDDYDDDVDSGTPTSVGLRSVSSESSGIEGSLQENSIAGDESYSLPAPPPGGHGGLDIDRASPLLGYGNALPPLPSSTTVAEREDAVKRRSMSGDATMPSTMGVGVGAGGWKKALKRISILGGQGSIEADGAGHAVTQPSPSPVE
ncbi:hypothetical protein ACQY0O_002311 [Thecaphora frezii]